MRHDMKTCDMKTCKSTCAAPAPSAAPLESRLLSRLDEPLAAGFYELRNASQIRRIGRGLKRYAESIVSMPAPTGRLYPAGAMNLWNLNGGAVGHPFSSGLSVNGALLRDKIRRLLPDGREKDVAAGIAADLENLCVNPMSNRFCVGGRRHLRVHVLPEDEAVVGHEQQGVDLVVLEEPASGLRRVDRVKLHLRLVERLRRPLQGDGEPRGRGSGDRVVERALRVEEPPDHGRDGQEREDQERRGDESLAAKPLANLSRGDEGYRASATHRSTSSRKSSASDGGP